MFNISRDTLINVGAVAIPALLFLIAAVYFLHRRYALISGIHIVLRPDGSAGGSCRLRGKHFDFDIAAGHRGTAAVFAPMPDPRVYPPADLQAARRKIDVKWVAAVRRQDRRRGGR